MLSRARHRAKLKAIPFDLAKEDINIPEVCPVLGLPLKLNKGGRSGFFSDSPALDRIRPELGYVKGNVRVISSLANRIKSDLDAQTLRLVLEDLERIENGGV